MQLGHSKCVLCVTRQIPVYTLGKAVPSEKQTVTLSQAVPLNAFPPPALSLKTKCPDVGGQGSTDSVRQHLLTASCMSGWEKRGAAVVRTR